MTTTRKYLLKRSPKDSRDFKFKVSKPIDLPAFIDLAPKTPIFNQGILGSCTGNAISTAIQYEQIKQCKKNFVPSRLFIYYNERVLEGTVNSDSGASIKTGMKTVAKYGVCDEQNWTYSDNCIKYRIKPSDKCYKEALDNQVLAYYNISQTLNDLKECLADGFPIVAGIMIYSSFETPEASKTGIIPIPKHNEELKGGHCILIVGYDEAKKMFKCRNSWGSEWGDNGYFYLPYDFVLDDTLAFDFWSIKLVE